MSLTPHVLCFGRPIAGGCCACREIGTPYTLNISLDSTVPNNASAATFAFTIHNEKTDQHIEVGKILTTNPSGTHGIPAGRYVCDQMPVGGGSFQECEGATASSASPNPL